ncbi:MAG: hypothetical protein LBE76_08155 [Nitrososphaerota archaeon]|nr:hypothetical protein [Nitrososphaerota archaeon]
MVSGYKKRVASIEREKSIKKRILLSVLKGNQKFTSILKHTGQDGKSRLEKKKQLSPTTLSKYLKKMTSKEEGLLEEKETRYTITQKGQNYLFDGSLLNMLEAAKKFSDTIKACMNPNVQKLFMDILTDRKLKSKEEKTTFFSLSGAEIWGKNRSHVEKELGKCKDPKRKKELEAILNKSYTNFKSPHLEKQYNGKYIRFSEPTEWHEIINEIPTDVQLHEQQVLGYRGVPDTTDKAGKIVTDSTDCIWHLYTSFRDDPEENDDPFKILSVKEVNDPLMNVFKELFGLLLYLYGQVDDPQEMIKHNYFFFDPEFKLRFRCDTRHFGNNPFVNDLSGNDPFGNDPEIMSFRNWGKSYRWLNDKIDVIQHFSKWNYIFTQNKVERERSNKH